MGSSRALFLWLVALLARRATSGGAGGLEVSEAACGNHRLHGDGHPAAVLRIPDDALFVSEERGEVRLHMVMSGAVPGFRYAAVVEVMGNRRSQTLAHALEARCTSTGELATTTTVDIDVPMSLSELEEPLPSLYRFVVDVFDTFDETLVASADRSLSARIDRALRDGDDAAHFKTNAEEHHKDPSGPDNPSNQCENTPQEHHKDPPRAETLSTTHERVRESGNHDRDDDFGSRGPASCLQRRGREEREEVWPEEVWLDFTSLDGAEVKFPYRFRLFNAALIHEQTLDIHPAHSGGWSEERLGGDWEEEVEGNGGEDGVGRGSDEGEGRWLRERTQMHAAILAEVNGSPFQIFIMSPTGSSYPRAQGSVVYEDDSRNEAESAMQFFKDMMFVENSSDVAGYVDAQHLGPRAMLSLKVIHPSSIFLSGKMLHFAGDSSLHYMGINSMPRMCRGWTKSDAGLQCAEGKRGEGSRCEAMKQRGAGRRAAVVFFGVVGHKFEDQVHDKYRYSLPMSGGDAAPRTTSLDALRFAFNFTRESLLAHNRRRGWQIDTYFHVWQEEYADEIASIYESTAHVAGAQSLNGYMETRGPGASIELALKAVQRGLEYDTYFVIRHDAAILRPMDFEAFDDPQAIFVGKWCKAVGDFVTTGVPDGARACRQLKANPNDVSGVPDFWFAGSPAVVKDVFENYAKDLREGVFAGIHGPTPYTLHPTLYTLHPIPCTLHPTPYTLNPTPTRNSLDLRGAA